MPSTKLMFAYPLSGGGSEYTFGDYVWTVQHSSALGWEITVAVWADDFDVPSRVVASGFATAGVAEQALLANCPTLYSLRGEPIPGGSTRGGDDERFRQRGRDD